MDQNELRQIFLDTDYVHKSGTPEELRAAEYLRERCRRLGFAAELEPFAVPMGDIEEAQVFVDGRSVPCKGVSCCGSGEAEAAPGETVLVPFACGKYEIEPLGAGPASAVRVTL